MVITHSPVSVSVFILIVIYFTSDNLDLSLDIMLASILFSWFIHSTHFPFLLGMFKMKSVQVTTTRFCCHCGYSKIQPFLLVTLMCLRFSFYDCMNAKISVVNQTTLKGSTYTHGNIYGRYWYSKV